jgi:hypothetical protein
MVQLALAKVLVKKKIPPAPSIFIVKGFAKLLHSFAHVVIVPEIKAPVLKPPTMAIGRLLLAITPDGFHSTRFPFDAPIAMLSANAAVGKERAKSADSIIRLILTPPRRRFLAHLRWPYFEEKKAEDPQEEDSPHPWQGRFAIFPSSAKYGSAAPTMNSTVKSNNCHF